MNRIWRRLFKGPYTPVRASSNNSRGRMSLVQTVLVELSRDIRFTSEDVQRRRIADVLRVIAANETPMFHPKMREEDVKELRVYAAQLAAKRRSVQNIEDIIARVDLSPIVSPLPISYPKLL